MVRLKRVYEVPEAIDGYRVLVDRLWPRGMRKDEAHLDGWLRDLAPSSDLRAWFGHEPSRWAEFRLRYQGELRASGASVLLDDLANRAKQGTVTLLFAAHDTDRNNAVVLRGEIERRSRSSIRRAGKRSTPRSKARHRSRFANRNAGCRDRHRGIESP